PTARRRMCTQSRKRWRSRSPWSDQAGETAPNRPPTRGDRAAAAQTGSAAQQGCERVDVDTCVDRDPSQPEDVLVCRTVAIAHAASTGVPRFCDETARRCALVAEWIRERRYRARQRLLQETLAATDLCPCRSGRYDVECRMGVTVRPELDQRRRKRAHVAGREQGPCPFAEI